MLLQETIMKKIKYPIIKKGKFPKSFRTGKKKDEKILEEQIHVITYKKP
jgi:hypothetical protein